jgi:hypothetical protein
LQPVVDLLHPDPKKEKRQHKKKRLVQVSTRRARHGLADAVAAWRRSAEEAARARGSAGSARRR